MQIPIETLFKNLNSSSVVLSLQKAGVDIFVSPQSMKFKVQVTARRARAPNRALAGPDQNQFGVRHCNATHAAFWVFQSYRLSIIDYLAPRVEGQCSRSQATSVSTRNL
jgi:hypothetical protein